MSVKVKTFKQATLLMLQTFLVQLVERWFPKPDVVGSIPTGRDFINKFVA